MECGLAILPACGRANFTLIEREQKDHEGSEQTLSQSLRLRRVL